MTSKPKAKAPIAKPKNSLLKTTKRGRTSTMTPEQVAGLLEWIADGRTQPEINNNAANFIPAFKVSPQLVHHYRSTRGIDLDKMRQDNEFSALSTGLALKANRLAALYRLARRLEDDIEIRKRLWLDRKKSIITGPKAYEVIVEKEFIGNLVKELRGVYSDIAAETGGRVLKADITSKGKQIKGYVSISPEDWDKQSKQDDK